MLIRRALMSFVLAGMMIGHAPVANSGPYAYLQGGDYFVDIGESIWKSSDREGEGAYLANGIYKAGISEDGHPDESSVCFIHVEKGLPALMFCEAKPGSALSGVVWQSNRSAPFSMLHCIASCKKEIPQLQAGVDGAEGDEGDEGDEGE